MDFNSKKIEGIYAGKVAKRYERSMPPFFLQWKKKAISESAIKRGDKVLVFCCGTGLDFPYIMNKIGEEGKIVGIDFSEEMLIQAQQKIEKNYWRHGMNTLF